jgi:serine/threonine protein kinase
MVMGMALGPGEAVGGPVERLGEYRLLERIGEGTTAVVHCAIDALGRTVAVKELRPEFTGDPKARRRLGLEMAAQGRVSSPYVARLLGGDTRAERPYSVSQYVPGTTLRTQVGSYGPLPRRALLSFAAEFAEGIAAVHEAGVVHHDVTPGNVMVLGGSPMIIDFGLAHDEMAAPRTHPGMLVGTPAYLAPELIEGEPAGPAADVFSWASTLAFAATGRPPFGSGSLHSVCFRILRGAADLEGVAEPLASLLRMAFRRDPAQRPSAGWLARSLQPWRDRA